MNRFVKNEKAYEKSFDADWKSVKKGLKKVHAELSEPKKVRTSITSIKRLKKKTA